jgi:hypothetical protein
VKSFAVGVLLMAQPMLLGVLIGLNAAPPKPPASQAASSQPVATFARAYLQYREAIRADAPEARLRAWLALHDRDALPLLDTLIAYDTEIDPWADDLTRSWDRVRWMRRRMTWRLDRMAGEEMQRTRTTQEATK